MSDTEISPANPSILSRFLGFLSTYFVSPLIVFLLLLSVLLVTVSMGCGLYVLMTSRGQSEADVSLVSQTENLESQSRQLSDTAEQLKTTRITLSSTADELNTISTTSKELLPVPTKANTRKKR